MTFSQKRLSRVQKEINKKSFDAIWVDNPISLFYLTGYAASTGILIIQEKEIAFFLDGRYLEDAKEKLSIPVFSNTEINNYLKDKQIKKMGFDATTTTVFEYEKLKKDMKKNKQHVDYVAMPHPIKYFRMIKDESELKILRDAAKIGWEGFLHIQSLLKEGITEEEVGLEFEIFCRKKGASGLSFPPIIAFGANSSRPHYKTGKTKLKKDDIVLMDLGVVYKNYCSDLTRICFVGTPHPELQRLYYITRKSQKAALACCKPKTPVKELDLQARSVMKEANVEELFIHNLGHGVGIEVHEPPSLRHDSVDCDMELEENMVITIEPGLYLPGVGGIRYEDTIIITKDGYENLYPEDDEI